MQTLRRLSLSPLFSLCLLYSNANAQAQSAAPPERVAVTAAAASERVRFSAPNRVARLRLEVFSPSGETLAEVSTRGSVLDWGVQDGEGNRLADGTYLCVLTVKDVSGRIMQRLTLIEVAGSVVTARAAAASDLTARQAEAVGPVEREAGGIVAEGEAPAATLLAHDGAQGQLVTTSGDLSFRGGDFFTGRDKELMRLSADGSLTVEGSVLARGGIRFSDGTVLSSAVWVPPAGGRGAKGAKAGASSADDGGPTPSAAGTGTLNRLAKWAETGGAGTLTDSAVFEAGGLVGIGTASPALTLDVNGSLRAGQLVLARAFAGLNRGGYLFGGRGGAGQIDAEGGFFLANDGTNGSTNDGPYFLLRGNAFTRIGGQRGSLFFGAGSAIANAGPLEGALFFQTGGLDRVVVNAAGNVGVGTTSPAHRLDVVGSVNASQFNTGGQRLLVSGAGHLFVGVEAGLNTAVFGPVANTFVGTSAGDTNVSGSFNTVLGASADVGANNLANATAVGARSLVTQSNSLVLGSINGINSATADTSVGIGTTTPDEKLEVSNGVVLSSGSGGAFVARNPNNQSAALRLDWINDTPRIRYGGTGAGAENGFVIQGQGDATKLRVRDDGDLVVAGDIIGNGTVIFGSLDFDSSVAGPSSDVCVRQVGNVTPRPFQLTQCSSSIRYKTDVAGYAPGLDLVRRLRPVSFRWRGSGTADLGFVAEEVAEAEPLLATKNARGEIEGVKYDRITAVLVNAVREQQQQIKSQRREIAGLKRAVKALSARRRK